MRITSGMARGISLLAPKGGLTRPATDAARQAVFSSLGDGIAGARVLDLFAGTGAYGLEALSRGAISATFVESNAAAFEALKKNISAVSASISAFNKGFAANAIKLDCFKAPPVLKDNNFDFVFADPPYDMLRRESTLFKIMEMLCRILPSIAVLEAPAEFSLPEGHFSETVGGKFAFKILKRLGKNTRGKPAQLIFKIEKK